MSPNVETVSTEPVGTAESPIETDAVVVGAGPAGLFQVFELGLLEIKAHVVDTLECAGGQCIELYPDKPIYDIPGLPFCTGRELIGRLLEQIKPFGATFHLGQQVTLVHQQADGRFLVETSKGIRFLTRTLFIAGGVGGFLPRKLKLEGIERHLDTQLLYSLCNEEQCAGRHLVVLGDGDAALEAAAQFAQDGPQRAASVTLVHRRDAFRAAPANVARMRQLCASGAMQFVAGEISGFEDEEGRLTRIEITSVDGAKRLLRLDMLMALIGLSPKLGPIADWGLGIERKQVVVDTEKFESNVPGIFAVGDISTYPGKKKLILSGFHEAALASFGAARHVFPDKHILLQYTTTSPRLHKLRGVELPGP